MIYHNLLVSQRECLGFGLLVEASPDGGCVETEVIPQLGQTLRLTSRRRASELVFKMGAPTRFCGTNTCVHTCTHRYLCTHMHTCTRTHTCTKAHVYTCTQAHTSTQVYTHAHMYTHAHINIKEPQHTCANTETHTHTNVLVYTQLCTPTCVHNLTSRFQSPL